MIYIVILNYNNWKDTIECLESVFNLKQVNYKIVICDNKSTDNSLNMIEKWAKGKLVAKSQFPNIINPLEEKPIKYKYYTKREIEKLDKKEVKENLILIDNQENRGYSAGNNIGIRYALQKDDCEYIWILNNDVVVESMSLKILIDKIKLDKSIGMCGSKTYYYYNPTNIQCEGGYGYNKWLAIPRKCKSDSIDYINGASILVSKNFINDAGCLSEDYFLYFEEIDWAIRGKQKGYKLGYAENSIIYHKEGGTISKNKKEKSLLSDFYSIRNRIVFTKKFYKYCLPTVYVGLILAIINRIKRKQYNRIKMIFMIMISLGDIDFKDVKIRK